MSKRKFQAHLALLTALLSTQGAICGVTDNKHLDEAVASTGASFSAVSAPLAPAPAPAGDAAAQKRPLTQSALIPHSAGEGGAAARSGMPPVGSDLSSSPPVDLDLFGQLALGPSSGPGGGSAIQKRKVFGTPFPFACSYYHQHGSKKSGVFFVLPLHPEEGNILCKLRFDEKTDRTNMKAEVGVFPIIGLEGEQFVLAPLPPSYEGMFKVENQGNLQRILLTNPQKASFLCTEEFRATWALWNTMDPKGMQEITRHIFDQGRQYMLYFRRTFEQTSHHEINS